ncbi:unnamed protein product, partial [Mesorhabditis belari]|uniref:Uncharacterized protein n=1 Tax=Mesorhabditis belari TaxID=2138241 RepID=A0AAF3J4I1_9BILA
MEKELRNRWDDVTTFMQPEARDRWWNRIVDAYRSRPFRGLSHLSQMFFLYDKHKDQLKERYGCAVAIFFKNIVYDAHDSQCTEKSVQVFNEFAQGTTLDQQSYVTDLINQSASSSTEANLTPGAVGTEDVHYLIDFDMAFLGDEDFDRHEKAIRKEYPELSDEDYRKMRLRVLTFFLQIPNIYATAPIREEREGKARENIQKEIGLLEAGNRTY